MAGLIIDHECIIRSFMRGLMWTELGLPVDIKRKVQ